VGLIEMMVEIMGRLQIMVDGIFSKGQIKRSEE
jgi:hypothetical protein